MTIQRALKTRRTSVIGLLAPKVSDALASQVMPGVEEVAQECGYTMMMAVPPPSPPTSSAAWGRCALTGEPRCRPMEVADMLP
ncbi:hypothetical protein QFZ36_003634 [Pseudarthrobacter siccitolerans]|uniref:Uncharacterized protein n=1 Tax=Pseudarthrobacter siccitolerans TaxID=861266 RepID=A0ABU0PQ33_9MICC|nr:hypothetical protein [Pseudarthrobacter siccitolerans]MDQ0676073.1 hypothetical protein [Pseudarthrobacter siccitolerans]